MAKALGVRVDLQIIDTPAEVHAKVMKEIASVLNKQFSIIAKNVQDKLRARLGDVFYNSDEYTEILRTGRGEFGFESGTAKSRMKAIIDGLQQTVVVTSKRLGTRGGNFTGGLIIEAFPSDFNYILALPEAQTVIEDGSILYWLFEMLFSGDKIIIADYEIRFGAGKGRSGIAHMIEVNGGAWRVPPKLSGVAGNNWITRTVKNLESSFNFIIEDEVKNVFHNI